MEVPAKVLFQGRAISPTSRMMAILTCDEWKQELLPTQPDAVRAYLDEQLPEGWRDSDMTEVGYVVLLRAIQSGKKKRLVEMVKKAMGEDEEGERAFVRPKEMAKFLATMRTVYTLLLRHWGNASEALLVGYLGYSYVDAALDSESPIRYDLPTTTIRLCDKRIDTVRTVAAQDEQMRDLFEPLLERVRVKINQWDEYHWEN